MTAQIMHKRPPPPHNTLCNIDLLRGVAAVIILFWHYQHFYYPMAGVNTIASQRSIQPLFDLFPWFYLYGSWAVQFFWILSGFIFFHVYSRRGEISNTEFFINRFSRLYPLHFITLCLVAVLQWISWQFFGHFQIYPFNDLWHFFLNVLMASHWGFQQGYSFNAPIWSISVEVLTYCMFFAFLKVTRINLLTSALWLCWSLLFYSNFHGPIFECATLFALGGFVNQAHELLVKKHLFRLGVVFSVLLLAVTIVALIATWVTPSFGVQWLLFPTLIWLAAALETSGYSSSRFGLKLGEMTYASYLLHIPVQIVLIMLLDGMVGNRSLVDTPAFLFGFIVGVMWLSNFVYQYVEHPLKLKCKKWMKKYLSHQQPIAKLHEKKEGIL